MRKLSLVLCLTMLFMRQGFAETLIGRVVGVLDGDTIEVLDESKKQYRVRLNQIDAPEKGQAFGDKSKRYLSNLVYNKDVIINWYKRDRYDRLLANVTVDKIDVNFNMVLNGYAWAYNRYVTDVTIFQAQHYAEKNKLGLWAIDNNIPPWEFRHQ